MIMPSVGRYTNLYPLSAISLSLSLSPPPPLPLLLVGGGAEGQPGGGEEGP